MGGRAPAARAMQSLCGSDGQQWLGRKRQLGSWKEGLAKMVF